MKSSEQPQADAALIARVAAHDPAAAGEMYDRHSRLLYGLILRIVGDQAEAEEVLQEVFIAVWNRAESYDARLGSPVAWLVGISRNRAIDRLRANSARLRALELVSAEAADEVTPETQASCDEEQRAVARALQSLPPTQRQLIEEAYYQGLTQSELAARHHLPLGTVKTRIRKGMLTLREKLSPLAHTT
jgi:RNA polymerase sigma-70 factor (ECF subfamily)